MRFGILALQGAFVEHTNKLGALGADTFEIRQLSHLNQSFDGIILPGGESTVMGKLLSELRLLEPLREAICNGLPVFGTCAGLILLSKEVSNAEQPGLHTMDIACTRNSYGRQLGSFHTEGIFAGRKIPMVFIRAPHIHAVGNGVDILARVDGKIVAAQQDNMLATAFHPELADDDTVYRHFIGMAGQSL